MDLFLCLMWDAKLIPQCEESSLRDWDERIVGGIVFDIAGQCSSGGVVHVSDQRVNSTVAFCNPRYEAVG